MTTKIGISACLLGQKVRFNGGHKRARYIQDVLGKHFTFMPMCPEMGIGMGVPRPPIRLITTTGKPDEGIEAVLADDHSVSFTDKLKDYAAQQAEKLTDASGFIFMQKSPSCGYTRVKLYHQNGNPLEVAQGIFAAKLDRLLPLMPKEEAGRLNDPVLRENFITRVLAYKDWQEKVDAALTKKALLAFHVRYKYLIMAHHVPSYKTLGQLVSNFSARPLADIAHDYISTFMEALKHVATRKKNTNVLQHLQGYLKKHLQPGEKQELSQLIHHYRQGIIPLVAPVTLLSHHIQKHTDEHDYLRQTLYINPHPYELGLRNAV